MGVLKKGTKQMVEQNSVDHGLDVLMKIHGESDELVTKDLVRQCYEIQKEHLFEGIDNKALNKMKSLVVEIVAEKMKKS